ncbi:hypothetical protein DW054_16765, partial [Dorea formicigenerans]
MKSFRMCFILSCLALFLTLESVQNLSIPIEIAFILSIMEEIIIFYVKPIKNSNRPVAESVQNLSIPIEIAFILSIMEEIIIFYVKPIKNSNRP